MNLSDMLKVACKRFGHKENYKIAKLFNKNGIQLFQDDLVLLSHEDILYMAIKGEDFNYSAILDDYTIGKELGVGGFGKVMLGKHKEEKKEVAIKFMDVSESLASANTIQEIYREAESLKKLNHKNIIALYHAFLEGKQLCMIMEYAAGGELYKYVEERQRINEIDTRRIIIQIINAMSYCHNRGIVHRDLKLENVLFKAEGDLLVKVVDFGIAGVCAGGKKDKVDAGSIAYMPPETFKSQAQTSPAIDVWAIGVMMYAMLYGHLPFWGDNEDEFIDRIINAPLKFDAEVPVTADLNLYNSFIQDCKEMIKGMLQKDPERRLQLIDVMNLPYYMLDDEDLEEDIKKAHEQVEEVKHRDEETKEKQWESDILSGLHLNQHSSTGSSSNKSTASKTPSSKPSAHGKEKTPASSKGSTQGSSFGSSLKNKKPGGPPVSSIKKKQ